MSTQDDDFDKQIAADIAAGKLEPLRKRWLETQDTSTPLAAGERRAYRTGTLPEDLVQAIRATEPPAESFRVQVRDSFASQVRRELDEIGNMLIAKNEAYGNSALDPIRCFSHADPVEQLRVRIDDKLSRLMRGGNYPGDDTVLDLIGYLVLLRIAGRVANSE